MSRSLTTLALLLAVRILVAQSTPVPEKQNTDADNEVRKNLEREASYGYMAPAQDAYQGAWSVNDAQHTAELWKALCEARPADVNAQFNWFRSERNARLSSNNGQLKSSDEAELNTIADRISTTAPGSFEQHLSAYYVQFPAASSFSEAQQAYTLQPQRTEVILPMLNRANVNGDKAGLDQWSAQLETRGELAPVLTDVAGDVLQCVGDNGVLFTNGDLDCAPALVRQRRHDDRRDVLIVDQRLLADANYRTRIWMEAKASGPVPAPGPVFASTLTIASARPVYLALSLDRSWFEAFAGRLCSTGLVFKVGPEACDMRQLEKRWALMKKPMTAGPLSRNYLLPGSLLLQHLRQQGDGEERAAKLEFELRTMAKQLGATQDLIKAGVLTH